MRARVRILLRPRLFMVAALAALAAVPAAATVSWGSTAKTSKVKRVSVKDDFFSPRSISVGRGGKVTWTWRGENEHTVTFTKVPTGARKKGAGLKTSGSFTRSFTKKGTYKYVCEIHLDSGMRGSVIVR